MLFTTSPILQNRIQGKNTNAIYSENNANNQSNNSHRLDNKNKINSVNTDRIKEKLVIMAGIGIITYCITKLALAIKRSDFSKVKYDSAKQLFTKAGKEFSGKTFNVTKDGDMVITQYLNGILCRIDIIQK